MESRWYQTAAIQNVFEYVAQKPEGAPLIALPTGTGKGFVIAEFIRQVFVNYPRTRVIMATHVKELIEQNAKKLTEVWPLAPLGIYSAGLGARDLGMPITFAGVASIYKRAAAFGHVDILIIDEAHLLSPDSASMYQKLIAELKKNNPRLVVIGLTATAYRMGQGMLTEGDGIFTDICFDMTDISGFNQLIAEGFLCPLFPKKTHTTIDLSSVGVSKGEFNATQLEHVSDKTPLIRACLEEMVFYGSNRNVWMIFAAGIKHAEHIAEMLREYFRVTAIAVHSKLDADKNDEYLLAYKRGDIRCLVNVNKATTGFDHPPIDLIGHMRGTMSPGLWVQMNGRGTRPSPDTGKTDCLALDFAGNTKRLGPINDPIIPKPKGSGGGDAPIRLCPSCGVYNPAAARICFACGYEFTFQDKLQGTASEEELVRSDAPVVEEFKVKRVLYSLHQKEGKLPCMKVAYVCGAKMFLEWIFLDHGGLAGHKSRDWWRQRHAVEPPTPGTCAPYPSATTAALSICSQLKVPKTIRVWTNRPYPEVQSCEY